jgi:acetyltransferase
MIYALLDQTVWGYPPKHTLNATFINKMPRPGNIAFISQSGALGTAILDWVVHENVGFSHFVSLAQ